MFDDIRLFGGRDFVDSFQGVAMESHQGHHSWSRKIKVMIYLSLSRSMYIYIYTYDLTKSKYKTYVIMTYVYIYILYIYTLYIYIVYFNGIYSVLEGWCIFYYSMQTYVVNSPILTVGGRCPWIFSKSFSVRSSACVD